MARIVQSTAIAALAFASIGVAHAAQPAEAPAKVVAPASAAPPAPAMPDEEEKLDDGLKRFGYLTGLARGCVIETQGTALDREALDLHASIARLLGTDRAFLFATAFGYGTTVKLDIKDCPEVLKAYEARVARHRAASGRPQ